MGGVTEFMKVAALTQAYDLMLAPHGPQDCMCIWWRPFPTG